MPRTLFNSWRLHTVVVSLFLTSGCANLTTYNRLRYDTAGISETTYIDAKQRAVFAIPQPVTTANGTVWSTRVCAEPSPDALSALAAAGNGSLSFEQKASAQAAFSISETASNIGLRTQSIQLMRDAMYRMCEGVASGTLSQSQFETLFRRFQNSMVAILAIEQLTGVVKGSDAQLSTTSGAGASKEIADLAENTAKAQDASSTADTDAATKAQTLADATAKRDAYLKTNGVTADTLSDAQKTDFAPLQQAVTDAATANAAAVTTAADAKEKLAIYQAGLQAVHGGDLTTSGTATSSGGTGGIDATAAVAVAQAVENIVTTQLDKGFFRDTCPTVFDAEIDGRVSPQAAALQATCDDYARVTVANNTKQMDSYVQTTAVDAAAAARYSADYGAYILKWGGTSGINAPSPGKAGRHANAVKKAPAGAGQPPAPTPVVVVPPAPALIGPTVKVPEPATPPG